MAIKTNATKQRVVCDRCGCDGPWVDYDAEQLEQSNRDAHRFAVACHFNPDPRDVDPAAATKRTHARDLCLPCYSMVFALVTARQALLASHGSVVDGSALDHSRAIGAIDLALDPPESLSDVIAALREHAERSKSL
jgi:hypothetical protein